jgi:hypothetical protein
MTMLWKLTCCSLLVFLLATLSVRLSESTCEAVTVVNGSTNISVFVQSSTGQAGVPPATSLVWPDSASMSLWVAGTNAVSWSSQSGHEYFATLSNDGSVVVTDKSASQTFWYWWGAALGFGASLLALSARWVRRVLGGSVG